MVVLSIALYVIAAALLAFGILKGIKNGIIGQSLRLAVNLLSALTALLIGAGLLKGIANIFAGNDLAATVSGFGVTLDPKVSDAISSIDPSTVSSIASVPVALLIVPILTIIVYIIVKLLLGIPLKILAKIIPDGLLSAFGGKLKLPLNKILGAAVGVLGALITLAIIVFPFASASSVAYEVSSVLRDSGEVEIADTVDTYSEPIRKNGAVSTCRALFGGVYGSVTSVKTADGKVHLESIAHDGAIIGADISALDGKDVTALGDEEIASVSHAVKVASDSPFFCPIVLDLLSVVTDNLNAKSLGIDETGVFAEFADQIISIFATADKNTLYSDVETLLKVVSEIREAGVFDGEFTSEKLLKKDENGKSAIGEIVDILSANDRYSGLCTALSNAALSMVLDNSGVDLEGIDAEKASADIKSALVSVSELKKDDFATETEYNEAVTAEVKSALLENGIDVDEKITDEADKEKFEAAVVEIVEEMDISEEISDEEMLKIMISYYEKYMATEEAPLP